MKKRYVTLPVTDLVSDVAVDREHVERLAASLKAQGQLAPVQIRGKDIIDGFHRVAALIEIGIETVDCIDVECTEEEFLDLRIASALTHEGVKADRAVPWIIAEVEKVWPGQEAYSIFKSAADAGKGRDAQPDIWANLKAETWGVVVATLANWLSAHRRLAPDVWEDKELDYGHRRQIGKATPDHVLQRQLAKKAKAEDLTYRQIDVVAQAAAKTEDAEERRHILETPLDEQDADDLKRRAKVAKFLKTPPVKAKEDKRREEADKRLLFFAMSVPDLVAQLKTITQEEVDALTPDQRAKLQGWVVDLGRELNRVRSLVGIALEAELIE